MFDLSSEEARLLLNVAMMAAGRNRFESSGKILSVLERFRPREPSVACAVAVLILSRRDFAGAVEYIDSSALARFPGNPMLLAFKGMALLRMDRRSEAEAPLRAAAEQTSDPAAAKLAGDLLI
jgi:Flp pilus assembly protein TadD